MKNKPFKVYIEVPSGWMDSDSPFLWGSTTIRDEARKVLKNALIEQVLDKSEIPEITISKDEIREAVKERMVDMVIENQFPESTN